MVSWCVAHVSYYTKINSLRKNTKTSKIRKKNLILRDLPRIIDLCKEHFEESFFNNCVHLRRILMKSKDQFKVNFVFGL